MPRPARPAALAWALRYLPHYLSDEPCAFHAELLRDLEAAERRLIARVGPRGHAKSTLAALAYPLWSVCEKKRSNIMILTHESSLARQFVRDIRHELETNERILEDYGDLCREARDPTPSSAAPAPTRAARAPARRRSGTKWSEALFTTTTGVTVQAKGSGSSLRGVRVGPQRPDLIICDDIEKDQHVESPEARRKLEHWLRRVVMPALAPDGQLLVLGSIIHHDALLANLADRRRFPRWDYRVYRALEAEPGEDGQYYLTPLWPARWPLARLEEERERVGSLAFEQEYQANPIDDSIRVFEEAWLRPYDPAEIEGRADLVNLLAVDPAAGVSGGDFFALWAGSLDPASGVLYTRQLSLQRVNVVGQVRLIVAAFERWKPVRLGIETVAYQHALKDILEEHSRRHGCFMPIVGLRTVQNKRARIEGVAPFFENGLFRLPPGLSDEIEQQFLRFPKARHDDAPDVCAMGIELARSLRSGGFDGRTGGPGALSDPISW